MFRLKKRVYKRILLEVASTEKNETVIRQQIAPLLANVVNCDRVKLVQQLAIALKTITSEVDYSIRVFINFTKKGMFTIEMRVPQITEMITLLARGFKSGYRVERRRYKLFYKKALLIYKLAILANVKQFNTILIKDLNSVNLQKYIKNHSSHVEDLCYFLRYKFKVGKTRWEKARDRNKK